MGHFQQFFVCFPEGASCLPWVKSQALCGRMRFPGAGHSVLLHALPWQFGALDFWKAAVLGGSSHEKRTGQSHGEFSQIYIISHINIHLDLWGSKPLNFIWDKHGKPSWWDLRTMGYYITSLRSVGRCSKQEMNRAFNMQHAVSLKCTCQIRDVHARNGKLGIIHIYCNPQSKWAYSTLITCVEFCVKIWVNYPLDLTGTHQVGINLVS